LIGHHLKPGAFKRMGQSTGFNLHRPTVPVARPFVILRCVAAQVDPFERHVLKPRLVFKGKGLKPSAFQATGLTEFAARVAF
jgi:hypothetical protein